MSAKSPQFLFVNCTNSPYAETQQSLHNVRRHVMHDHVRKRSLEAYNSTIIARKKHKRHERLTTQGTVIEESQNDGDDAPSTASSGGSSPAGHVTPPHTSLIHPATSPGPQSLESHRFDPFSALPIDNIRNIDSILWWHFKVPARQSVPARQGLRGVEVNFNRRMNSYWTMAQTNDGFLHSLICLSEIKKAFLTGQPRDEVSYYEHRGAALGIIIREFQSK